MTALPILAGAMAFNVQAFDPLDPYAWNDCPDVAGLYAVDVPHQAACSLFIETAASGTNGPLNQLIRDGRISCDGFVKPIMLRYETAPGSCVVHGSVSVPTVQIVGDDDNPIYEATNGSWSLIGPSTPDEACGATDHWHILEDWTATAILVSEKPYGYLFRCYVEGTHPTFNAPWDATSSDFKLKEVTEGSAIVRTDALYHFELEVDPNTGDMQDEGAAIRTEAPGMRPSTDNGVITAVKQD